MGELHLAEFRADMKRAIKIGQKKSDAAIMRLALKAENALRKRIVEGGSHKLGTKTPARKGRGPAMVTGQLRQAVGHKVTNRELGDLSVRVGVKDTVRRRSAGARSKEGSFFARGSFTRPLDNGRLGLILERKGYKFMQSAYEDGTKDYKGVYTAGFAGGWR